MHVEVCSRRTIIIFLWARSLAGWIRRTSATPLRIFPYFYRQVLHEIFIRSIPLLTTAGFRLRSCLPIANFFVKLILHEMRTSTILSGKNYPLFLRQILHEIFMVRVDSIDFGQHFGDDVSLRSPCFAHVDSSTGLSMSGTNGGPRIIRVYPFLVGRQKTPKPGKMANVRIAWKRFFVGNRVARY